MPKIFSEAERVRMIESLRGAASECLALYGVRKTTVDELVGRCHMAKGTFYLFYDSKEALFLDVVASFGEKLEAMYLEMLQNLDENHIVTSLTQVFAAVAMKVYREGIFRFLEDGNLELMERRIPERTVGDVREQYRRIIHDLFSYFSIDDEEDIGAFVDGYSAILELLTRAEHLHDVEKTVTFLIRGLVLQMVE